VHIRACHGHGATSENAVIIIIMVVRLSEYAEHDTAARKYEHMKKWHDLLVGIYTALTLRKNTFFLI